MKQKHITILLSGLLALSVVLNIVLCTMLAISLYRNQAEATLSTTPSGIDSTEPVETKPSTEPDPTEPPTTIPDPTEPPVTTPDPTDPLPTEPPATEPVTRYTQAQLEALENKTKGYGPGNTSGGKRAPYAQDNQQTYGDYAAHFIAPDNGKIYLTFDCGYEYFIKDENGNDVALTGLILDTLKEKEVKAVFFVTMSYCQRNPDLVRRMINEGHTVGNHSNSHPSMPSLTIAKMEEEIMSLHTYVQENFGYTMTLFRPPMGEFSTRSLAVTQNLGYESVFWSFAYADWDTANQPAPDAAYEKIVGSAHSGAIYLLHAVSETNTNLLGDVIDAFQAAGYDLVLFN